MYGKSAMEPLPKSHDEWVRKTQHLMVRSLARSSSVGAGLLLVGGSHYSVLKESSRISRELDYRTEGDLTAQRARVLCAIRERVIPDLKRRYGVDAIAGESDDKEPSPFVRSLQVAFNAPGLPKPVVVGVDCVDINLIPLADEATYVVLDGTIIPTISDADMVESKILSIFNRVFLEYRDIVDVFLFQADLRKDSAERLLIKFSKLGLDGDAIARRMKSMYENFEVHASGVDGVLESDFEEKQLQYLRAQGGGTGILRKVLELLSGRLQLPGGKDARD